MLNKYPNMEKAIHALGESPPKKWLFTMNLPTGLLYDNYGTTWDNAPRWGQRRYLQRIFRRYFGKQFPLALQIFELTKERRNVHMHAICDSPFDTIDQYKDWYYDLRKTSEAVRSLDPHYKAFDLTPVTNYEGLISDYLLKDPYGEAYTYKNDGKPHKVKSMGRLTIPKEDKTIIKKLDHGIILTFD